MFVLFLALRDILHTSTVWCSLFVLKVPLNTKQTNRLPCLGSVGCAVGGLLYVPSKIQVSHQTQRSIAGDLGQPVTGTDRKRLLKVSHYDWRDMQSWWWTF